MPWFLPFWRNGHLETSDGVFTFIEQGGEKPKFKPRALSICDLISSHLPVSIDAEE
jgi:hypothetical protein